MAPGSASFFGFPQSEEETCYNQRLAKSPKFRQCASLFSVSGNAVQKLASQCPEKILSLVFLVCWVVLFFFFLLHNQIRHLKFLHYP